MADKPAHAATLTALQGSGADPPTPLARPITIFGNAGHCDVVLASAGVSQTHAAVIRCADGWYVADLSGLGETRVNAVVCRWRRLKAGDELSLGRYRFRYDGPSVSGASANEAAVLVDANGARHVAAEPTVVIGTAWFCDRVVRGAEVAPVEAMIACTAEGFVVRGLGRTGRVRCNKSALVETRLTLGDRITVGDQTWTFDVVERSAARMAATVPQAELVGAGGGSSSDLPNRPALTLSAGIFDDDDTGDSPAAPRGSLARLDSLTHTDKLDRLVAGRLPVDLRPRPMLRAAAPDVSDEEAVQIDARMARDLARLERVQDEVAQAARQTIDVSVPKNVAPPVRDEIAAPQPPPVRSTRLGEPLSQRPRIFTVDTEREKLDRMTAETEQRQAELDVRAAELRSVQHGLDKERVELRNRAAEYDNMSQQLVAERRQAERERQATAAESERLAERARVLAETQARVDQAESQLNVEQARLAEHVRASAVWQDEAAQRTADVLAEQARLRQRRARLREALRQRRESMSATRATLSESRELLEEQRTALRVSRAKIEGERAELAQESGRLERSRAELEARWSELAENLRRAEAQAAQREEEVDARRRAADATWVERQEMIDRRDRALASTRAELEAERAEWIEACRGEQQSQLTQATAIADERERLASLARDIDARATVVEQRLAEVNHAMLLCSQQARELSTERATLDAERNEWIETSASEQQEWQARESVEQSRLTHCAAEIDDRLVALELRAAEIARAEESCEQRVLEENQRLTKCAAEIEARSAGLQRQADDLANAERKCVQREREQSAGWAALEVERAEWTESRAREQQESQTRQAAQEAEQARIASVAAQVDAQAAAIEHRAVQVGLAEEACERRELEIRNRCDALAAERTERERAQAEAARDFVTRTAALEQEIAAKTAEQDRRAAELDAMQVNLKAARAELEQREARLTELWGTLESQLRSSEEAAAQFAEQAADLERRQANFKAAETALMQRGAELERTIVATQAEQAQLNERAAALQAAEAAVATQRDELGRRQSGLETEQSHSDETRKSLESREARLTERETQQVAMHIQLQERAETLNAQRDELNRQAALLTLREEQTVQLEQETQRIAERAARLDEQEQVLRDRLDAHAAAVGDAGRERDALEAQRAELNEATTAQERQRNEWEQTVSDRLAALESELAARRRDVEAALEARRGELDAATTAARHELDERGESLSRERAAIQAERMQLDAERASAELRNVIGELSPPRRRDDVADDAPADASVDIETRQSQLDQRAGELEQKGQRLEADWARFSELQAEFDAQQRAWAEQREEHVAAFERQRSDLAEARRQLESRPAGAFSDSASDAATADAARHASHRQPTAAPLARPRTRMPLIAAASLAGLALGYFWPEGTRTVRTELQATGQVGRARLLQLEQEIWQPELLRAAAVRANAEPDVYEQWWQNEKLDSRIDPQARSLLLTARAPAGEAEQSRILLDALAAAYGEAHHPAASQPDADTTALRTHRDELAATLAKLETAATAAEAALDSDASGTELRTMQARMTDAKSQYDHARAEADSAANAAARMQQQTADDAARVIDPAQVDAALAADGMYAADAEQVASQSLVLQGLLVEVDRATGPLLSKVAPLVDAVDSAFIDAGRTAAQGDLGDALEAIRRQLADYKTQMDRFGIDWKSQMAVVTAWKPTNSVKVLLDAHRQLSDRHEALARQGLTRLDAVRTGIEQLLNGTADTARRDVLQASLSRTFRPVQENYAELMQATSGVSGAYYPRVEAARRTVTDLSERMEARRTGIEAALAQRIRTEWASQHEARVIAAQRTAREAGERRDRLSDELGVIQNRVAELLAHNTGLEARRSEAQTRRDEADKLQNEIAGLDAQMSGHGSDTKVAALQLNVTLAHELETPTSARLWRGLIGAGLAALLALMIVPLMAVVRFFRDSPRTLRTGTTG